MIKRVMRISRDNARVRIGGKGRRKGKNIGTGRDSRQSSQDKPTPRGH